LLVFSCLQRLWLPVIALKGSRYNRSHHLGLQAITALQRSSTFKIMMSRLKGFVRSRSFSEKWNPRIKNNEFIAGMTIIDNCFRYEMRT
jgi:hypothetical protein